MISTPSRAASARTCAAPPCAASVMVFGHIAFNGAFLKASGTSRVQLTVYPKTGKILAIPCDADAELATKCADKYGRPIWAKAENFCRWVYTMLGLQYDCNYAIRWHEELYDGRRVFALEEIKAQA